MPDFPYLITHFPEHNRLKKFIMKAIKSMEKSSITNENELIHNSDWNLPKTVHRPYFQILFEPFDKHLRNVFLKLKHDNHSYLTFWYNQYKKNNTHGRHQHRQCNWVCLYYLDLPDNTPVTHFENVLNDEVFVPEVVEGDIIIFPGFVWHYSPPNPSNKVKTIISCNVE